MDNALQDIINKTSYQNPIFKAPSLNLTPSPLPGATPSLPAPKAAAAPAPAVAPTPAPTPGADNSAVGNLQAQYSAVQQHSADLNMKVNAALDELNKATENEKNSLNQATDEQKQGIKQYYQATIDAVNKLQGSITAMPDKAPEMQDTQKNLGAIGSLLSSFMMIGTSLAGGQYGGLRAAAAYNGMVDTFHQRDVENFKIATEQFRDQVALEREKNQQAIDMFNSTMQGLLAGRNMDKEIAELEMKQAELPATQAAQKLGVLEKMQTHADEMLKGVETMAMTQAREADTAEWRKLMLELKRDQLKATHDEKAASKNENQVNRSFQYLNTEMDKVSKPIEELDFRLDRLNATLAEGTPQADALIAPELLTVMSGGAGSGLRMNEAEIARVIGGRSKWQDLEASINKWKADPSKANSITPEQRQQIRSLVDAVNSKMQRKRQILNDARDALVEAHDVQSQKRIFSFVKRKLTEIDEGRSGGGGTAKAENAASVSPIAPKGLQIKTKDGHILTSDGKGGWN